MISGLSTESRISPEAVTLEGGVGWEAGDEEQEECHRRHVYHSPSQSREEAHLHTPLSSGGKI